MPGRQCLRPVARLHKGSEYRRVFRQGIRVEGPLFSLLGIANGGTGDRLGLAAGRRLGNAVVRNRLKRLARESFRKNPRGGVAGLDLVLVPKPAMIRCAGAAVEREYERRLSALAKRGVGGRRGAVASAGN